MPSTGSSSCTRGRASPETDGPLRVPWETADSLIMTDPPGVQAPANPDTAILRYTSLLKFAAMFQICSLFFAPAITSDARFEGSYSLPDRRRASAPSPGGLHRRPGHG